MRRFNEVTELLKDMPLNSTILVLLFVVLAAFLAPTDSNAQAVPPRVQSLMINRPIVVPPEPPVQKEIRELKREIQATTPIPYYRDQLAYLRAQLACFEECAVRDGKICGRLPFGQPAVAGTNYRPFCDLRAEDLRQQIADIESRLGSLKGANK